MQPRDIRPLEANGLTFADSQHLLEDRSPSATNVGKNPTILTNILVPQPHWRYAYLYVSGDSCRERTSHVFREDECHWFALDLLGRLRMPCYRLLSTVTTVSHD